MYTDFINKLSPLLSSHDFEYNRSLQAFTQIFPHGEKRFIVKNNFNSIEVAISTGIKFKIVDQILCKIYNIRNSNKDNTIFINLYNTRYDFDNGLFLVSTEEETKLGIEKTYEMFNKVGLQYFKNYSSLLGLNQLINESDIEQLKKEKDKIHNPKIDIIFIGLIVAQLLMVPNLQALEQKYTAYALSQGEEFYNEFINHFISYKEFNFLPFI